MSPPLLCTQEDKAAEESPLRILAETPDSFEKHIRSILQRSVENPAFLKYGIWGVWVWGTGPARFHTRRVSRRQSAVSCGTFPRGRRGEGPGKDGKAGKEGRRPPGLSPCGGNPAGRSCDRDAAPPPGESLQLLSRATQVFREQYVLKQDLAKEEIQRR